MDAVFLLMVWALVRAPRRYIIQTGSAMYAGKMLRENDKFKSVWGEDIVLRYPGLQLQFPALAATYLHTLTIDGATLHTVRTPLAARGSCVSQRAPLPKGIMPASQQPSVSMILTF